MQARRIARELALLSTSQLPANPQRLAAQEFSSILVAAIRTLTSEVQDTLETAATELQRSKDQLLGSEFRAPDPETAKAMVSEAIALTEKTINHLAIAVELPEFIQLANQQEVRAYTQAILGALVSYRADIDQLLTEALVDWQLSRLAQIDRDILRIAVVEMLYLGQPDRVAINEAVELAKRYSGDDGHRFINGVLRRVTDQLKRSPELRTSISEIK
ncbi:transcription antiterminator NusB [Neosynechococcus sphagnicola sy1]|uniref:Transcription antitermination protein NusB n=1 Tax=Neosynechococcus sphagnicola sy1 TaxID=1497020 RepID=A0A098TMQ4_9CYAN|nr:transcription antitermination factor NusB [Neosynechococcus sphagnicola]KGF72118.1 transcription antiterminator NusB [Neosynechococcus sphagnicola sy1]